MAAKFTPSTPLACPPELRQAPRQSAPRGGFPKIMRRPLILNGFMATGKSTVGALVAQRAERPFIDLDRVIEAEVGSSVEQLFAARGEATFRSLERAALERILAEAHRGALAPVIAVGGGALLPRDLRLKVLDECVLVTLEGSAP